jgi:hypothetical protein
VTAAPGIPCTGEEEKIIEQERDEIGERRKREVLVESRCVSGLNNRDTPR